MESRTEEKRLETPEEEPAAESLTAEPSDPPIAIHELLVPAQNEIKAHLRRLRDRILEERREAAVAAAAAAATRVDLGQRLGQLQAAQSTAETKLRSLDSTLANIKEQQDAEREELEAASQAAASEIEAVSRMRARVQRLHAELSKSQEALYNAEEAHRREAAELAATKRAAFVAEDRAGRAVEANRHQDARVEALRATLEGLEALTASHNDAAASADQARDLAATQAREAAAACEAAVATAAQLERQWEAALGDMRRLDAELMRAAAAAGELGSKRAALENEAAKVTAETAAQAEANWQTGRHFSKLMEAVNGTKGQIVAVESQEKAAEQAREAVAAEALRIAAEGALAVAAAKEADGHVEELQHQRFRAENECSEVQGRLAAALERLATADGTAAAALKDLRSAEAEVAAKASEIRNLESTIKNLEGEVEAARGDVEASATELATAEAAVAAAAAAVDSEQATIEKVLREIETVTREVQEFNRERQRLAEAGKGEDVGPLQAEVDRLRAEIQKKEESRRVIQGRWVEAQEALLAAGRTHAQAQADAAAAETALAGVVQRREALEVERRAVEEDIEGINGRLKGLKLEQARLDAVCAQVAAAQVAAERDVETRRASQLARLQGLEEACTAAETRIIGALEQHRHAAATAAVSERQAEALAAKKKEKAGEAIALRQLKQGTNAEAAALQGRATALKRQLSATQRRRTMAAGQLQRAVAASGIEKAAQRLDPKHAELAAAKQRLAAARLHKRAELARRAGAVTRESTSELAAASEAALEALKAHGEEIEQ